jgi:hypothetical protein|tara:strand:+ start:1374 stop:1994 length:621 start_codon:yes stop_codon:yes gene_type:complete
MATKLATKKIEEFGTNIVIPDFNLQTVVFPIIGTNRLVMHKFSEKARKEIEDKQQKKGTSLKAKGKRDPQAEYEACIHYCDDGTPGFPGGGFKKSLVRAAQGLDMKMTEARSMFQVVDELVQIEGEHQMRTDMVRLNGKVADVRYRAEFPKWKAKLRIRFNPTRISVDQLATIVRLAGFSVGVGEYRPERDGSWGTFDIEGDFINE